MSDNSSCFFNRHCATIVHYSNRAKHPDRGKNVFILELSSEDWDVLSNAEFSNRLTKALLFNTSFIQIESPESHQFMKFLKYIIPLIHSVCPVRLCADGCRTNFIESVAYLTDGVCIDIRIPLKKEYSKKDRDICKVSGEYRSPLQYRDSVKLSIGLVDHLPLSIFRIHKEFMTDEDVEKTMEFLLEYRSPIIVGR